MGHCHFCKSAKITNIKESFARAEICSYDCPRCGSVNLTEECAEDIAGIGFTDEEKKLISIYLRNEYEKNERKAWGKQLTLEDLRQIIDQNPSLPPLEKIDRVLLNLEKESEYIGFSWRIDFQNDYPYYRTRYFTDSGIIGTKAFVSRFYHIFKDHFSSKHEKRPIGIQGLAGVYSLKRLSEAI